MKLYLVRHAQPESGSDPNLSSEGVAQAEKLGAMFKRLIPLANTSCLTSDQQRAKRTGSIIFGSLRDVRGLPAQWRIREFPRSTSDVEPAQLLAHLRLIASEENPKNMIAVWHHPSIGAALNLLIGSSALEWPDIFGATAHVTCPASLEEGSGKLRWFILPELLP